jgi:dipeptidase
VDGDTLFGHNSNRAARRCQPLQRTEGRAFALGEKVHTQYLDLLQARQTATVLGSQPVGYWGYDHGVNEYQVAVGCTALPPTLPGEGPGLLGTDLVRLVLERTRNARQAVDLLTDLIGRHGQGRFPGCPAQADSDHAFLIADPHEAFAVEAAGCYWVSQEIGEVRAVSDTRVIRQDWDCIARGLAAHAIAQGWWPGDGSKLDFAGALGETYAEKADGLRRWGRATFLLQQQNGHIDVTFVRRLLSDHYEGTDQEADPWDETEGPLPLCQHARGWTGQATVASLVASLRPGASLPWAWYAFGPPCSTVYFPIFLDGELPETFTTGSLEPAAQSFWWRVQRLSDSLQGQPEGWARARDSFGRLQARFDQEAVELAAEGAKLKEGGAVTDWQRQASLFMEYNLERFDAVVAELIRVPTLGLKGPRSPRKDSLLRSPQR